ncbi:hypothetical protein CYMTET_12239 [Cymbomonas tetramitiformis]|uniref:Uncharacterized protein n=1 Tax=Cymbomonas tetramitiformis TaxID=36881 RepID=A0AAE0GKY5_9CHLO|nr:hypothetical protein CYMTET_12239 [Cymbomonas tetramitiformis]
MSAPTTRAKRKLLLKNDIDSSIRLVPSVRDSPTPSTPPVPIPAAAQANDPDEIKQARALYESNVSKIVVVLKNEFGSAGLDLVSFALDDPTKEVIEQVNELLYDTLAYIVKGDSPAEHFLLGTDSVSDRDNRRALLDLIKGCVPPGVRRTLQEEHSQLRYPARVDPRPVLAKEQRLVRDNRAEDWTPTEMSRKYKMFERLDPDSSTRRIMEVLGTLTSRLEKIESAIKYQRLGGASAAPPKQRRGKGLDGYRTGRPIPRRR